MRWLDYYRLIVADLWPHCVFQNALNTIVVRDMRSNRDNVSQAVLAVEVQHKESKSVSYDHVRIRESKSVSYDHVHNRERE